MLTRRPISIALILVSASALWIGCSQRAEPGREVTTTEPAKPTVTVQASQSAPAPDETGKLSKASQQLSTVLSGGLPAAAPPVPATLPPELTKAPNETPVEPAKTVRSSAPAAKPVVTAGNPRPKSYRAAKAAMIQAQREQAAAATAAAATATATSNRTLLLQKPAARPAPPPAKPEKPESEETAAIVLTGGEPDPANCAKVKVFYATDRAVSNEATVLGWTDSVWFSATATAAILAILLAIVAYRRADSRAWLVGAVSALLIAGACGALTVVVRSRVAESDDRHRQYGAERGVLEFGVCEVNVPKQRPQSEVDKPSIFHLDFAEDPLSHVNVLSVRREEPDLFFSQLKSAVNLSPKKDAFVFIHGYNVGFQDAARRTAQIAADLKFDGAPILYSWPSQDGLLSYLVDETNVVWSVPHLKAFLTEIAKKSSAKSVHLIAHSMGNRALTAALREMHFELDAKCPKFQQVVLAAPDVDAEVFRRDLAPAMLKTAQRVTLYASSDDEALAVSKKVHGYARAGESGDNLVVLPGMDTIDVSNVENSMLGHSYYGDNRSVLADLFELLLENKPPNQRQWLQAMGEGAGRYWSFVDPDEGIATARQDSPTVNR